MWSRLEPGCNVFIVNLHMFPTQVFWFELTFQLFVIEVTVGEQRPQEHLQINVWKITISTLA